MFLETILASALLVGSVQTGPETLVEQYLYSDQGTTLLLEVEVDPD